MNHADQDGRTALCVAAFCVPQSALHSAVVAKLLQLGADPNIGDREHVTPLIGAANTGRRDICELCLEADADVDMIDKSVIFPFHTNYLAVLLISLNLWFGYFTEL